MKTSPIAKKRGAGERIIESLLEAIEWTEGKDVAVGTSTFKIPGIEVRELRRRLGLSQAEFAVRIKLHSKTAALENRRTRNRRICSAAHSAIR